LPENHSRLAWVSQKSPEEKPMIIADARLLLQIDALPVAKAKM